MSISYTTDERMRLFLSKVNELFDTRLIASGKKPELNIKKDIDSNKINIKISNLDEDDFKSFLLTFRHFVSKKEPIYLPRILNFCIKSLDENELILNLQKAKASWNETLNNEGEFKLKMDGEYIAGEEVLDIWINGYYFHSDFDNNKKIRGYLNNKDLLIVKYKLITILPSLVSVIDYSASVVEKCLKENLFNTNLE